MQSIQNFRKRVDEIDEQILRFLGERAEICRSIGLLKKSNQMPIVDRNREAEVFEKVRRRANDLGLEADQTVAIYREIVNMCSTVQKKKKGEGPPEERTK
jgi:chorismate mutase